jgi:hypothetical protein
MGNRLFRGLLYIKKHIHIMKRIAIGAFIATVFGVLILSCVKELPRSYDYAEDIYLKYENIDSIEGNEIHVQWLSTRWDNEQIYPPMTVIWERTLTPDDNRFMITIRPSDGFDKNYIDVVGIRRDSIHNWFIHYEEYISHKPPKLRYMYYFFNGVRYTEPTTITIDLAGK